MGKIKHPDYIFIIPVVILMLLGGLILVTVSAAASQEKFGTSFYYLKHQGIYGFLPGLILALFLYKINLSWLKKWAPLFLLINLVFLAAVFLPFAGLGLRGATRWISLGPISFQPSEFLKLTFLLYLSSWLATKKEFGQNFFAFLTAISAIGLLLIFQPDVSTLLIIIGMACLMYFVSGTPLRHTFFIGLLIVVSFLFLIIMEPYRYNRISVLLNPESDPMGQGYQIKQALIAVGSGGIAGQGLEPSLQKFGFIPHSISDSIFAIFANETGFIGSTMLLLLYVSFFWRGLKIWQKTQDKFFQLSAFGITFWITFQSFLNIGSMLGVLPIAGVPLPFISYGGSHLITELAGVGILANISKQITL